MHIMSKSGFMAGKRGLIMGVANSRSIAWGIARACAEQGAELAFSYQGEALKKRVAPLAEEIGVEHLLECDVSSEESIEAAFAALEKEWGGLDFLVHAIAFSDKDELKGRYVDTTAENFALTMNISVYSFTAVARHAEKLMKDSGSMLTLSYYGAEKWVPHYNVMGVAKAALESATRYLANDLGPDGIRVNAISPGPMRTLAGAAIGGARKTYRFTDQNAPMRSNATLEAVGGTAVYLASDAGCFTTGEIIRVDGGFHILGMPQPDFM
jgi:enoyl-[acyl-carrier protein] reductase I